MLVQAPEGVDIKPNENFMWLSLFQIKELIKKDSIIIDVGINRQTNKEKTRLVGDVKFEDAHNIANKITPVPGGVGPMTIACLMYNTVKVAFLRKKMNFEENLF